MFWRYFVAKRAPDARALLIVMVLTNKNYAAALSVDGAYIFVLKHHNSYKLDVKVPQQNTL